MDRINGAGHVNRRFVAEDPAKNRPPTEFTAEFFNGLQEEGMAIIEGVGLVPDINDNTQVRQAILKMIEIYAVPVSTIVYLAGSLVPKGWLKCNGATISRSAYSALFSVIGTTYGAGDGVSTFNLPDLRGEFLRGFDDGRGVDSGRVFGSAQASTRFPSLFAFSANSTTGSLVTHPISVNTVYPNDNKATNMDSEITTATGPYMTAPLSPGGGTNAVSFTARPRNVALLPIIKY